MGKKVLVLGGLEGWLIVYVDHLPTPTPQTVFSKGFHETVGGTGFGKAISLSRLGLDVTFHSTIGSDDLGRAAKEILERELNFVYDIDPAGTRRQIHITSDDGERLSYFLNHGSLDPIIDLARIEEHIVKSDVLVVNTINYTKSIIPIIKRHQREIWCDIHDYHESRTYFEDFIDSADYLQFSSSRMSDYRAFMRKLVDRGKKLVVCTHAHRGATALTADGEWVDMPAINRYMRRDSNGAGDGFFAGMLYGLMNQYSIDVSMRFGAIVGGLAITTSEPVFPSLNVSLLLDEYRASFGQEPTPGAISDRRSNSALMIDA